MRTIENFRFNDVVLYAKGWYERSGDFMKDLDKYIRMNDNFLYPPEMSEIDIMSHMLKALDIVYEHCTPEELKNNFLCHSHAVFFEKVRHNQAIYKVSFEQAACLVVYSILQGLDTTQIILNAPRYDKRHRHGGGMFHRGPKHGMTYKEMYRRWENIHKKRHEERSKD